MDFKQDELSKETFDKITQLIKLIKGE